MARQEESALYQARYNLILVPRPLGRSEPRGGNEKRLRKLGQWLEARLEKGDRVVQMFSSGMDIYAVLFESAVSDARWQASPHNSTPIQSSPEADNSAFYPHTYTLAHSHTAYGSPQNGPPKSHGWRYAFIPTPETIYFPDHIGDGKPLQRYYTMIGDWLDRVEREGRRFVQLVSDDFEIRGAFVQTAIVEDRGKSYNTKPPIKAHKDTEQTYGFSIEPDRTAGVQTDGATAKCSGAEGPNRAGWAEDSEMGAGGDYLAPVGSLEATHVRNPARLPDSPGPLLSRFILDCLPGGVIGSVDERLFDERRIERYFDRCHVFFAYLPDLTPEEIDCRRFVELEKHYAAVTEYLNSAMVPGYRIVQFLTRGCHVAGILLERQPDWNVTLSWNLEEQKKRAELLRLQGTKLGRYHLARAPLSYGPSGGETISEESAKRYSARAMEWVNELTGEGGRVVHVFGTEMIAVLLEHSER